MSDGGGPGNISAVPATWRSLFAVREFKALWLAQLLSLSGDMLARVAVAVLVYDRTNSALITGAVYAISFLPWLIGGPLLSGLADRYPRRTVMITCHLCSAALIGVLAVPQLPLAALVGVLFVVVLLESPFLSSRAAMIVDILPDDRYVLASALNNLTIQVTQVVGFAVGGAVVALTGAREALILDAATFLLSAALIRLVVQYRAAAAPADDDGVPIGSWDRIRAGARTVFGDSRLRGLVLLAWLAAFWVVPEGLAAPYADTLGEGPTVVGLILAAQPVGASVGGLVLSRMIRPVRRLELMGPLAVVSCLPLIAIAFEPSLPVLLTLLVISGIGTSYNLPANAAFMQAVPADRRGQAFGLVAAGLAAGQGLSIAVAGAIADHVTPPYVIAVAGGIGLVLALGVSGVGRRFVASDPRTARA